MPVLMVTFAINNFLTPVSIKELGPPIFHFSRVTLLRFLLKLFLKLMNKRKLQRRLIHKLGLQKL